MLIFVRQATRASMDLLDCPLCLFLMCEPVTASCGHTFCRRCVAGCLPAKCPLCKERLKPRDVRGIKNNVFLSGVVEKCCPEETKMKCHIQEKLRAGEFAEALRIANEAIDQGMDAPCDCERKQTLSEMCVECIKCPTIHARSWVKQSTLICVGSNITLQYSSETVSSPRFYALHSQFGQVPGASPSAPQDTARGTNPAVQHKAEEACVLTQVHLPLKPLLKLIDDKSELS